MTLNLPVKLRAAMVDHAHADAPREACGLLAGVDDLPTRHVPMRNVDPHPGRYRFSPAEQLAQWDLMDCWGEDPVVVYHSHPRSAATPSRVDEECAKDPDVHYVIVSLAGSGDVRSYRLRGGRLREEVVVVFDGEFDEGAACA